VGLFLPHLVFPPFFLVLVATRWLGGRVPVRVSGWCFFVGGAQAAGAQARHAGVSPDSGKQQSFQTSGLFFEHQDTVSRG
jgi:hypothetical protein